MSTCLWCHKELPVKDRGRPRQFCGDRCRKAHRRAFPPEIIALPTPDPLPAVDPMGRMVLVLDSLQQCQAEAAAIASLVPAEMAWRMNLIAGVLRDTIDYCFGKET